MLINGFCHIFNFNLTSPTHSSKCHHLQIYQHSREGKRTFKLLSAQQYKHNHFCASRRQLQKRHFEEEPAVKKKRGPYLRLHSDFTKKPLGLQILYCLSHRNFLKPDNNNTSSDLVTVWYFASLDSTFLNVLFSLPK